MKAIPTRTQSTPPRMRSHSPADLLAQLEALDDLHEPATTRRIPKSQSTVAANDSGSRKKSAARPKATSA